MSEYFTKATRAVHRAAVRLHLVGLRAAVSAADRVAASATQDRRLAKAAYDAAANAHTKAALLERAAAVRAGTVAQAAAQEAEQIGGTL